jgi:hypothetical protein
MFKQLDDETFAVQDDTLQMTEAGLMVALRKIPFPVRRTYGAFWWGMECYDGDERWLTIKAAKRV